MHDPPASCGTARARAPQGSAGAPPAPAAPSASCGCFLATKRAARTRAWAAEPTPVRARAARPHAPRTTPPSSNTWPTSNTSHTPPGLRGRRVWFCQHKTVVSRSRLHALACAAALWWALGGDLCSHYGSTPPTCAQATALPEQPPSLGHGEHCSFGSGGTRRPSGDSPTYGAHRSVHPCWCCVSWRTCHERWP